MTRARWQKHRRAPNAPRSKYHTWYSAGNVGGYTNAAYKALKIARQVRKLVNVEYKHHDKETASFNVTNIGGGTMIPLTLIGQQTDVDDRIGNSLRVTSLQGRYTLARVTSDSLVRLVLFQDFDCAGTYPITVQLLDDATEMNSPLNLLNTDRFKILKDWMYVVTANSPIKYKKFFMKQNSKVEYIGTGANEASQGGGNYFLLALSNKTSEYPTLSLHTRVRYIDN